MRPVRLWFAQGFHCARAASFESCPWQHGRVNLLSATSASGNFCRSTDPGEQQAGGAATDERTQLRGAAVRASSGPGEQRSWSRRRPSLLLSAAVTSSLSPGGSDRHDSAVGPHTRIPTRSQRVGHCACGRQPPLLIKPQILEVRSAPLSALRIRRCSCADLIS